MKLNKMIEMLLSLGLLAGAGYLAYKYVLPKILGGVADSGGATREMLSGSCAGGSCSADKYNALLDDESDAGTAALVAEAQRDGLSTAGIGGLLANANQVVTATTLMLQRQLGKIFATQTSAAAGGGSGDQRRLDAM